MPEIRRLHSGRRYAKAVIHGDTVYLAGQVAETTPSSVTLQTREILAAIDALLAEAGTDKANLLMVNIWLADIATFDEMNAVWEAWVDPDHKPARATIESRIAGPYLIEIAAIAAR